MKPNSELQPEGNTESELLIGDSKGTTRNSKLKELTDRDYSNTKCNRYRNYADKESEKGKSKSRLETGDFECEYSSCSKSCGERRSVPGTELFPCACDYVCWVYGDCCLDFYSCCLGVQPFVSQEDLVTATLARLANLEEVHLFHEEWRLAREAECTERYKYTNSVGLLMINKCSASSKKQFQETLETLVEQSQYNVDGSLYLLLGLSEEEILKECEESVFSLTKIHREKVIREEDGTDTTLLSQIPVMHLLLPGVNFRNLFCGVCNGVPPDQLKAWNVSMACATPKDRDSFTMNSTLLGREKDLRKGNCEPELDTPEDMVRTCIPHENIKDIKDTGETIAPKSGPMTDSIMCQRYTYVFRCGENGQYTKNPHCRAWVDFGNSDGWKSAFARSLVCDGDELPQCVFLKHSEKESTNPEVTGLIATFFDGDKPETELTDAKLSFRIVLDFSGSHAESHMVRGVIPLDRCPDGQTFVPFFDRCQPTVCTAGLYMPGQRCGEDTQSISNDSFGYTVTSPNTRMPFPKGSCHVNLIFITNHALFGTNFSKISPESGFSGDETGSTSNSSRAKVETFSGTSSERGNTEQIGKRTQDLSSGVSHLGVSSGIPEVGAPEMFQHLSQVWADLRKHDPLSGEDMHADFVQFSDSVLKELLSSGDGLFDETYSILRTLCTFSETKMCTKQFQVTGFEFRKSDGGQIDETKVDASSEVSSDDEHSILTPSGHEFNNTDNSDQYDVSNVCFLTPGVGLDSGHACLVVSIHLTDTSLFDAAVKTLHKALAGILRAARTSNLFIESVKFTNMADPVNMTILHPEPCDDSHGKDIESQMVCTGKITPICETREETIVTSAQLDVNFNGTYVAVLGEHRLPLTSFAHSAEFSLSRYTNNVKLSQLTVSWCGKNSSIPTCEDSAFVKFSPHEYFQFRDFLILSDQSKNLTRFLKLSNPDSLNVSSLQQMVQTYTQDQSKGSPNFDSNKNRSPQVFNKTQYILHGAEAIVCMGVNQNSLKHFSTWLHVRRQVSTAEHVLTLLSNIISILSLALVLLVYASVSELRNLPGQVVMSLSLSLLVAQLLFLLSLEPAKISHCFCQVYAAVHHAAWLAAFLWLAAMSVNLARLLLCKMRPSSGTRCSRDFIVMAFLCWGIPVSVAGVCLALDINGFVDIGYGAAGVCFIGNAHSMLAVWIAPLMAILLLTIVCCLLVVRIVLKSAAFRQANTRAAVPTESSTTFSTVSSSDSRPASGCGFDSVTSAQNKAPTKQSARRNQAVMCLFLSLLMGGNWIFYLVAAAKGDNDILWNLSILLNGCQGLYVMLCFVAKRSLVARAVSRWRCGSCNPRWT